MDSAACFQPGQVCNHPGYFWGSGCRADLLIHCVRKWTYLCKCVGRELRQFQLDCA
eukprot:COSAG02_NODE_22684_length_743_cov_3.416149_1_plen_55_part_01